MSLFPAYQNVASSTSDQANKETEWLVNSSYDIPLPPSPPPLPTKKDLVVASVSSRNVQSEKNLSPTDDAKHKKRKRKEKGKTKKKKRRLSMSRSVSPPLLIHHEESNIYSIDVVRQMTYLKIPTILRPHRPRYVVNFRRGLMPGGFRKGNNVKKKDRYYHLIKSEMKRDGGSIENEVVFKEKVEDFNQKLDKNTHNVAMWLEFVNFQDDFYRFQHIDYETPAVRNRAAAQKKMSILEKAMHFNPQNEELQEKWLTLATENQSSDEVSGTIEKLIKDTGGSITLWLGLAANTQQSLNSCTFPEVTKLYEKAVTAYGYRYTDSDPAFLEILFHYCKFLDQAGHWELLWSILKVNLRLTFGRDFSYDTSLSDDAVKELENDIFVENIPLWHMWTRTERLREGVHFMPAETSIDYPQRCVPPESIVEFVRHIHPKLHFHLIVISLVLLKVPLLPTSHTILRILSSHGLSWTMDSAELMLSSVISSPAVKLKTNYLIHITKTIRGPQYLRKSAGQSEFLGLIMKTFEMCWSCLEGRSKTALGVWKLRFQRWIHVLEKLELASLPVEEKNVKQVFKDFLKVIENRDNLLYYREYSLLEADQGNITSAVKTLQTLISSRPPVLNVWEDKDRAVLCSLYRTLSEILISGDRKEEAVNILINVGNGTPLETKIAPTSLLQALRKYEHLSIELLHGLNLNELEFEEFLLPQFAIEWISCYMWLIALTKGSSDAIDCMNKAFDLVTSNDSLMADHVRESIRETGTAIVWLLGKSDRRKLQDLLRQNITQFPRNLTFLSYMASKELEDTGLWWNFTNSFLSPPTIFGVVILACVSLERFQENPLTQLNRLRSLLERLTEKEGRFSSILHGLRIRFLYQFSNSHLETAHIQALECCPWNKSMYVDGVSFLPAQLMQLTDVMVEKELRIHVTPDEVQELKD